MSAPQNTVWQDGVTVGTADILNTPLQGVVLIANLRAFIGTQGMTVFLQGGTAVGDGQQGPFYWNASSTATDNGTTIIVPAGTTLGAWVRLGFAGTPPTSGTSTTAMTIQSGPVTFETQAGLDFNAGQFVIIVDDANVANWMSGQITSYVGGAMTVNVTAFQGSGTYGAWDIYLSGTPGSSTQGTSRIPLLVTAYLTAGSFTFTAPPDTLTSDVFKFVVTGGGASGNGEAYGPYDPNGNPRSGYNGATGGTAIYWTTGIAAGQTVALVVGQSGDQNETFSGSDSTATIAAHVVTGGGGQKQVGSGLPGTTANLQALGGSASGGTLNLSGTDGGEAFSVSGSSQILGAVPSPAASFWGGGNSGNTPAPGAGGTIWYDNGLQGAANSQPGGILVEQYRGSTGSPAFGSQETIASASTTDLGTLTTNDAKITGTTNINSFGSSATLASPVWLVTFAAALTLTYNATSMILPTSASITTATNDSALFLYLGGGKWQCLGYWPFSGQPLAGGGGSAGSGGLGAFFNINASVPTASASVAFTASAITVAGTGGATQGGVLSFSETVDLATNGAGGMDTGSAPTSNYVAIYAISGVIGGTSILACAVATSSGLLYTGAHMPAGFTQSALLAILPTNGSALVKAGALVDRHWFFQTPITIFSNTAAAASQAFASQSIATAVPPTARLVDITMGNAAGSDSNPVVAADATGTGAAAFQNIGGAGSSATFPVFGTLYEAQSIPGIPIITSQTIYWADNSTFHSSMFVGGYSI